MYPILISLHRFLRFYFSVFSLVLISNGNIYHKTVFDRLCKHLEAHQKCSAAARRIFNSALVRFRVPWFKLDELIMSLRRWVLKIGVATRWKEK